MSKVTAEDLLPRFIHCDEMKPLTEPVSKNHMSFINGVVADLKKSDIEHEVREVEGPKGGKYVQVWRRGMRLLATTRNWQNHYKRKGEQS